VLVIVHEILHTGWFTIRGYFLPVGFVFVMHFIIDAMLLKLFLSDPGILLPIVKNVSAV
jgi:hypothetical protein